MLFRICAVLCNFYPRPPRGGRLKPYFQKSCDFEFLSTPSARRATRGMRRYCCPRTYFYPRPPRGGRPGIRPALSALRYFYPRPPRGGRPLYGAARQGVRGISIHALREEGDSGCNAGHNLSDVFLSTPSARRATKQPVFSNNRRIISIHALREEGDGVQVSRCHLLGNFYPRPPRGGRRDTKAAFAPSHEFLSTPSARRATRQMELFEEMEEFLSTPSARRATSRVLISCVRTGNFYPRPPRGGRPLLSLPSFALMLFLSTPSARRATDLLQGVAHADEISIHALREEGDSKNRDKISIFKQIIQHSARI